MEREVLDCLIEIKVIEVRSHVDHFLHEGMKLFEQSLFKSAVQMLEKAQHVESSTRCSLSSTDETRRVLVARDPSFGLSSNDASFSGTMTLSRP